MSADNWSICPKCRKQKKAEADKQMTAAKASYGKVSADEYERKMKAARELIDLDLEDTLREDWELGIDDDGEVSINYRASCEVCDFEYTFKHEEKLKT